MLKHKKNKKNLTGSFSLASGSSLQVENPARPLSNPSSFPPNSLSLSLTLTLCITKDPESDSKMKRMEGRMKEKWHVHQISGSSPSVLDGKIVSNNKVIYWLRSWWKYNNTEVKSFCKFYPEKKQALTSFIICCNSHTIYRYIFYTRVSFNSETSSAIPGPECHDHECFNLSACLGTLLPPAILHPRPDITLNAN